MKTIINTITTETGRPADLVEVARRYSVHGARRARVYSQLRSCVVSVPPNWLAYWKWLISPP